jgi:hypothetical protein
MSALPRPYLLPLIASLVLTACASTSETKLAVCDGRHRRPANPYGSVLPTVPLPGAPATSKSAEPKQPAAPNTAPGPLSRLDPKSTEVCGRPA